MLTNEKKAFITVIKSGIKGEKITLENGFNVESAINFAQYHQICSVMLYGLLNAGLTTNHPQMKRLFSCALTETVLHEQQEKASIALFSAFDNAEIDYMPLKGTLLKELYPKPELRVMSDADILIKPEQYGKIKEVMQSLGFSEAYESDHEHVWKKGSVTIELHKFLIPSYNTDYHAYFKGAWQKAENISGYRYKLNNNDEFIFVFTHFAKHYRDGGIGIKHFIDLWLCIEKYNLNLEYITKELEKIRLNIFFSNILNAINVFFNNKESSETDELIINTLITSGVYGKTQNRKNATAVRSAGGHKVGSILGRLSVWRRMLFPSAKLLRNRYCFLKTAPVLLPLAWIIRAVTLIFKPRRIGKLLKIVRASSSKDVVSMEQELQKVGLDFK